MLLYIIFPLTIDFFRAFYGPLNGLICYIGVYFKNVLPLNAALITVTMTITKFVLVCIYKSFPIMVDNFLSIFIYILINMISNFSTLARFYLPGRPVVTMVISFKVILGKSKSQLQTRHWQKGFVNFKSSK